MEKMEFSEQQKKEMRGRYLKMRRRLFLSTIPFFLGAAIALISRITSGRFLGIPFSIAGPVWYVILLATLSFHIIVWRCPACRAFLGFAGKIRFCPRCGFPYEDISDRSD